MNYKKLLLCGVITAGLILSVGCTKNEENKNIENNGTTTEVSETKKTEANYNLVKNEIKSDYVEAYYPQIEGLAGELTMDYINQDLQNALNIYIDEANATKEKIFVDYEITYQGEDLLSIIFKGSQKHEGREHKILKAVNIDLNSTNPINTANLIKSDEASKNAIKELVNEAAENNKNIKYDLPVFGDWMDVYFTDDTLVFYYLQVDDTSEDYIKLEIPKEQAVPYLNTEFGEHPAS